MRRRLIQISGFVSSTLGWVLVLCTVAMDSWKTTRIGNQGGSAMMTVLWYWSNLWKDCVTDATSVSNCIDFPALWNVTYIINGVRGLLLTGLTLGLLGAILCLVGMECTYIGGTDKAKNKLLLAGAVFHFVGGVADISAYALYISRVNGTVFALSAGPGVLRYNVGPPIFVGFAACIFIFVGALLYAVTVFQVICPESKVIYASQRGIYMNARSRGRTLYTAYSKPSRQYRSSTGPKQSSSSQISNLSLTTPIKFSERDAFV